MRVRERIKRWFRKGTITVNALFGKSDFLSREQESVVRVFERSLAEGAEQAMRDSMRGPDERNEVPPTKETRAMGKFEIFKDRQGQHRWRLRARNGRIVAVGEAYTRRHDALRSLTAVYTAALGARVSVE